MNNLCPSCGALYNVRPKDIGRRVKCKKCGSALSVADTGLVLDGPAAAPEAAPPDNPFAVEPDAPRRSRDRDRDRPKDRPRREPRPGGGLLAGFDPVQTFKDFGGFSTVLFAAGAFLVVLFAFQPLIGAAAVQRAQGAVERVDLDWKAKERKLRKDKKGEDEINKAREEFYKTRDREELAEDAGFERVGHQRARWFELYGLLLGFLLLTAGSVGYLSPNQPPVRRVLGAVVLGGEVLAVFLAVAAGGGCGGAGPRGVP
ncbi:MAG: zinc-ribbon domain-containing protein [Gemmataceae bacterium]|nr:zinc-ribbon domain-containing protein [Gemmataceae bacterium]